MDISKEAKRFREYSKKAYEDAKAFQKRCFNMFFYDEVVRYVKDEKEIETPEFQQRHLELKVSFLRGWGCAQKIFRNAGAADLLDAKDEIRNALHEIRILRKHSQNVEEIKAYENSLNIIKEALSKIPNRLLFR